MSDTPAAEKSKKTSPLSDFNIYGGELISYIGNEEEVYIPNSVKKICKEAFLNCGNIKKVHIPSSVKEIGDFAFYKCTGLKILNIPDSVKKIGKFAFGDCSKLVISIPNDCKYSKIFNKSFGGCKRLIVREQKGNST